MAFRAYTRDGLPLTKSSSPSPLLSIVIALSGGDCELDCGFSPLVDGIEVLKEATAPYRLRLVLVHAILAAYMYRPDEGPKEEANRPTRSDWGDRIVRMS